MAQFLSQYTHIHMSTLTFTWHCTCEYIDNNIEVNTRLSSKSQCTHMWLHWLLLSHGISPFICSFLSLVCIFQQCQYHECGNVSMGFWKSRVIQKSCQVTSLWLVTWEFCITCDFQIPILTFPTHIQYFHIMRQNDYIYVAYVLF